MVDSEVAMEEELTMTAVDLDKEELRATALTRRQQLWGGEATEERTVTG